MVGGFDIVLRIGWLPRKRSGLSLSVEGEELKSSWGGLSGPSEVLLDLTETW